MRAVHLLILVIIFLSIITIDLFAFYIFDKKEPGYNPQRFFEYSPITGYFHRPNSEGWWYRYYDGTKFYIRINSYGFADSERRLKKSIYRIALAGDSTTEFWETSEPYRGQYVIERLLNNKVEVLNFGVRAFGTDQTYLLFKEVGVHFSPDVLIYTFCINDIFDNSNRESKPHFVIDSSQPFGLRLEGYPVKKTMQYTKKLPLKSFLSAHSFTYRMLCEFSKAIFKKVLPLEENFELRPYKKVYNQEDLNRLEITLRIISLLNDFTKLQGIKFLLIEGVYRPAIDKIDQRRIIKSYGNIFDFNKISSILEDYCKREGIEFLSLSKQIISQQVDVRKLMRREDRMHLNKQGIQFFADTIVIKLKQLGWLD